MSALQVSRQEDRVTEFDSAQVSIEMEESLSNKCTIYKIPEGFQNPNCKEAYKPKLVSFGPYHHNNPQLIPMEEHKKRACVHFLRRANKHFQNCMDEVAKVVEKLMDSYDQLDEEWRKRESFLKMMIHDGCFMLEIIRSNDTNNDYPNEDPIFSKHGRLWKLPHIKRDMLMIENQLPLLLLKTLGDFEKGSPQEDESINELVMKFFGSHRSTSKMGLHVLDVVRMSMLQDTLPGQNTNSKIVKKSLPSDNKQGKQEVIWPATQLREAGIRFKSSESQSLKDINFKKGFLFFFGTLSLPEIEVDDATESKFLNLTAFEQLHIDARSEVTSYISFMDYIIDSEADVILLKKEKIIKNFVGTEKAVADLFNRLAYDLPFDRSSPLGEVHTKVTIYCNNSCRRWIADLWHTHFRSPWSCISLFAAIVLLCLTILQTVYSILDFNQS